MQDLDPFIATLVKTQPASPEAIQTVESELGIIFPEDYRSFPLASDGAEGVLGHSWYVSLWPVARIAEENTVAAESISGLTLFGSDGGGEAFAFDTRTTDRFPIIQIPFATLATDDVEEIGEDFSSWIQRMATDIT